MLDYFKILLRDNWNNYIKIIDINNTQYKREVS